MAVRRILDTISYTLTGTESHDVIAGILMWYPGGYYERLALEVVGVGLSGGSACQIEAYVSMDYPVLPAWSYSPNQICISVGDASSANNTFNVIGNNSRLLYVYPTQEIPTQTPFKYVLVGVTNDRSGSIEITPVLHRR